MRGNAGACTVFQARTAREADVITGNRDFAPAAEPALAIRLMFDGRFSGRTGAGRRTARADPDGTVLRQVSPGR
jgi:hypothetical protein